MTDDSFNISEEPPRDECGHPVHPEKGYPICAATKSDRTTPTKHGRERDDYEYCLQRAGWGEDRDVGPCRDHPITGEQWGESNPNYKNGRHSKFQQLRRKRFTEEEQELIDSLDLDEHSDTFAEDVVKELYARALRTGDEKLYREARQWAKEFGVIAAAPEKREVELSGEIESEVSVPEHVSDAIVAAAESNLEGGDS